MEAKTWDLFRFFGNGGGKQLALATPTIVVVLLLDLLDLLDLDLLLDRGVSATIPSSSSHILVLFSVPTK